MANKKSVNVAVTDEDKSELIRLWEGEECLYNTKIKNYHNINKRTAALKRIQENMTIPIDVDQIKKIKKKLRTTFLRERRLKANSELSGTGRKQVYIIKWKFYEELAFLLPYVKPIPTKSSRDEVSDSEEEDDYEEEVGEYDEDEDGEDIILPDDEAALNLPLPVFDDGDTHGEIEEATGNTPASTPIPPLTTNSPSPPPPNSNENSNENNHQ